MKGTDRPKGKGLIRSLNRKGTSFDKSPPVARRGGVFKEHSICERCGAIYERKSWHRAALVTTDKLSAPPGSYARHARKQKAAPHMERSW